MSPLGTFLRGDALHPNAAPSPLRITLARRLVETPGAPFVPSQEVFTDRASARDELGLLPASQGPTIVRVQVEGGTASEQGALAGDWLVDPDGGDRVARLPETRWNCDGEAKESILVGPWLEAWETCPNGAWMLRAAGEAGVARPLLVLAACACARTVLRLIPSGEQQHLRAVEAIEAAERWARGEASLEEVQAAATIARDISWGAASFSAAAASSIANNIAPANAAANAVAYAVQAATAWSSTRAAAMARCVELVRREIPTLAVLRTVATRASAQATRFNAGSMTA